MKGGEIQAGKTAVRDISAPSVTLPRCRSAGGDAERMKCSPVYVGASALQGGTMSVSSEV